MDRRNFLFGASGLAISQILMGCSNSQKNQIKVQLLKGSIPGQVVNQFNKSLPSGADFKFIPISQIKDIFKQLQTWQQAEKQNQEAWQRLIPFNQNNEKTPSDLVTLGDYWLKAVIAQKLIQPIETENIKQWPTLNSKWQQLVTRDEQGNLNTNGQVWAAPYRWGNTVIVYNQEKLVELDWKPQDWSDLWRPELRSQISLLNHPREVIGLVLKKLGKSYNTENITEILNLETELKTLNQQVKFYDSKTYLEPLITGDTWLAVGWSNDIIPLLGRYPKLKVVVPESGTAIWADLWVQPTGTKTDSLVTDWINFCWQEKIVRQITKLTKTNSPVTVNIPNNDLAKPLQNILSNNQELLDKSEFLLPLSDATNKQYKGLFINMKM